jgi:crotonobetainyl-CoA:carnitine CoA-transferase CaiB-like acyl-CoA transferase
MKPFEGLRVVELASVLAGPLAGSFFAEGGAEVIKVEHPVYGDVTRSWRAKGETPNSDISAYYTSANTYKKVIKLDLKAPSNRAELSDLLATADILLQNFKESDLEKFQLQPESTADLYPNLVHIRLVGFSEAPHRLAYDVVVQAETGFMHMNGSADGPPTRMPVALMDVLASDQIRTAALTGLYSVANGTRGYYAEVSLEKSGLSALVNQSTNYLMNGTVPQRRGSIHPNIAPYGDLLKLNGQHIVLAVGSDKQFSILCDILGIPQLAQDPRFSTNKVRVENREQLILELQKAASGREASDLSEEFNQRGVPAGLVKSLDEVFAAGSLAAKHLIEEPCNERRVIKPSVTAYSITVFGK